MSDFQDDETSTTTSAPRASGGRATKVEHESFDGDAVSAKPVTRAEVESDAADEIVSAGGLKMKASTLALLEKAAAIDPEDTSDDPDDQGLVSSEDIVKDENADPDDAETATPKAETTGEQKTETTPPPAPEVELIRTENSRLAEANKALLEEVERYKSAKPSSIPERLKPFADAEQMYFDDSIGAIRTWVAATLGVEKDSKEVDAELAHLYTDLTSKELNVPLDQSVKAAREAARARQALARDKRERKAEIEAQEARAKEETAARTAKETASKIESQLKSDQYPLLVNLSSDLTGVTPGEAVWRVLEQEVKMGRIDPKQSDDKLIAAAAKILEDRFTAVRDKIAKAQPPQPKDTAKDPKKPAEAAKSPSEGKRQSQGAPITNKAASVAPPNPPKPAEQKPSTPPKFKSSRAHKEYLLEKHGIK